MTQGQGRPNARSPTPSHAVPAGPGPTLTHGSAARRTWDVVVIGAGPAGSATAARLARAGLATLLLDRGTMPRGKVCGCCLSVAAVTELRGLRAALGRGPTGAGPHGLGAVVPTAVPLERVRVAAHGNVARIPLPGGLVVSREALDARLVELAIEAGCHWLPDCGVSAIDEDAAETSPLTVSARVGRAAVDARGGSDATTLHGHLVVLATGLADHVRVTVRGGAGDSAPSPRGRLVADRSRIGLGTVLPATAAGLPPGELVMAVGHEGYCGVVRLDDGRIDLAAAVDPVALRDAGGPADVIRRVLAGADPRSHAGWLDAAALSAALVQATPPLSHRSPVVAGHTRRIYRVGDAAGYVEPFTGEGIGWGLAGARHLAGALIAAVTGGRVCGTAAAAAYRAAHAAHFTARHARCGRVARSLRRPTLVAGAVRAARCAPWAARRVVPLLVGHGPSVARSVKEEITPP